MAQISSILVLVFLTNFSFAENSFISFVKSKLPKSQPELPVVCDFDKMTDNCKIFDDQTYLEFDDGTIIPNFSKLGDKIVAELADDEDAQEAIGLGVMDKFLGISAEVNDLFAKYPDDSFSPKVKTLICGSIGSFSKLADGYDKNELPQQPEMPFYLPMNDPNAKLKSYKLDKIAKQLKSKLTSTDWNKLVAISTQLEGAQNEAVEELLSYSKESGKVFDVSIDRRKKVEGFVVKAKKELIDRIKSGRPESSLGQSELDMIDRVKLIRFNSFESEEAKCGKLSPNAFYSPADHSFTLCDNLYNFPDEALFLIIGHELTHSIGPCNNMMDLMAIDRDRLKQVISDPSKYKELSRIIKAEKKKNNGNSDTLSYLEYVYGNSKKNDVVVDYSKVYLGNEIAMEELFKAGIFRKRLSGTSKDNYPFKELLDCLGSEEGGAFRGVEIESIDKIVDVVTNYRKKVSDKSYNAKRDGEVIKNAFHKFPHCQFAGNSQLDEAVSDWMGTELVASDLTKANKKSHPLKISSFFAMSACRERTDLDEREAKSANATIDIIQKAYNDLARVSDQHPRSIDRINQITFRNQKLRAALGCAPTDKKKCEYVPVVNGKSTSRGTSNGDQ